MNCEACGHENVEGARFCANCGITIAVHQDANDPRVGQMVGGRYRITGVIGEGGMGIVYEAEQQMGTTVRKVAVKTLHSELSRDPSVTARFHRECGTVAQLEHPNTIKVYDFGAMDDGTLYIAMEYLAGQSLDKVIEEDGALEPKRVKHLLKQIAGSLEEAHRQGIVHRDLKPENVILVERAGVPDVVKLLDFGIAARTESADAAKEAKLTQQGMVLGTPPYMSPEQFTGKALDKRSDIYSLAVMAYEMLTGKLPFDATTPWQWATEHMTSQPRPFETLELSHEIPKAMRDAILRALAKDREERFNTVTEFVSALDKADAAAATRSVVPGLEPNVDTSKATAAMAAAPDFGIGTAAPAPTAAMPAVLPTPPGVAAAVPAPPPREPAGSKGGGKGLIYGLVGLVVVLGGGIAVALSGGGGDSADPGASAFPIDTGPPAASIAPVDPDPGEDPPSDEGDDETDKDESSNTKTSSGTVKQPSTPPKTGGGDKPSTPTPPKTPDKPPKTTPTPPVTPPVPTTAPNPADACQKCSALASRSVISAAVQFQACSDAAAKAACSRRAKASAPAQAKRETKAGNCAKASQIRAAASSMNAGSPTLDTVVNACKAK